MILSPASKYRQAEIAQQFLSPPFKSSSSSPLEQDVVKIDQTSNFFTFRFDRPPREPEPPPPRPVQVFLCPHAVALSSASTTIFPNWKLRKGKRGGASSIFFPAKPDQTLRPHAGWKESNQKGNWEGWRRERSGGRGRTGKDFSESETDDENSAFFVCAHTRKNECARMFRFSLSPRKREDI